MDLKVLTFSCDLCRLFIAGRAEGEKTKKLDQWFPNLFRHIFLQIIVRFILKMFNHAFFSKVQTNLLKHIVQQIIDDTFFLIICLIDWY